jgi:hypothetical protein
VGAADSWRGRLERRTDGVSWVVVRWSSEKASKAREGVARERGGEQREEPRALKRSSKSPA